jgi:hypothetical protein
MSLKTLSFAETLTDKTNKYIYMLLLLVFTAATAACNVQKKHTARTSTACSSSAVIYQPNRYTIIHGRYWKWLDLG